MSDQHKCAGEVWQMQGFFPCTKTGRHKHGGKWYCKLHHPPTVQAKRAASRDRWNAKWAAQAQARVEAELAQNEMKRKAAAYDGLVAERDALKADAERYRYLRDNVYAGVNRHNECLWTIRGLYEKDGQSFDAAIDAARGKT